MFENVRDWGLKIFWRALSSDVSAPIRRGLQAVPRGHGDAEVPREDVQACREARDADGQPCACHALSAPTMLRTLVVPDRAIELRSA